MLVLCVGVVMHVKSQLYDVFDSLYDMTDFRFVQTLSQMDKVLESTKPQLVIYDATLASKKTEQTIKRLKEQGVKTLVISVDSKKETAVGYLTMGAVDVLEMPLRDHKIVAMLKKYVDFGYADDSRLLSKKHHPSTKYIRSVKGELPEGLDSNFLDAL